MSPSFFFFCTIFTYPVSLQQIPSCKKSSARSKDTPRKMEGCDENVKISQKSTLNLQVLPREHSSKSPVLCSWSSLGYFQESKCPEAHDTWVFSVSLWGSLMLVTIHILKTLDGLLLVPDQHLGLNATELADCPPTTIALYVRPQLERQSRLFIS